MTILVCTANTTPQDGGSLFGTQDTHTTSGHIDASIQASLATTNFGALENLAASADSSAHDQKFLIKFDMSAMPAGATVSSAYIQLYQYSAGPSGIGYSCYALLRDWVEGDGTGGSGATWNTYDGSNNWGTAGAANTTSDRESAAQSAVNSAGSSGWLAWDVSTFAQDVADGTLTNYGCIIQMTTPSATLSFLNVRSTDYTTDGFRPELWVEYTAPTPSNPGIEVFRTIPGVTH